MDNLSQLQGLINNKSTQLDTTESLEGQLATIPDHMKALYTVLSHLTVAIADLGAKTVSKDYVDGKIEEADTKITANATEIASTNEKLNKLTKKVEENNQEMLIGLNSEIDSRIKKMNNVIIFGVPESQKQDAKGSNKAKTGAF